MHSTHPNMRVCVCECSYVSYTCSKITLRKRSNRISWRNSLTTDHKTVIIVVMGRWSRLCYCSGGQSHGSVSAVAQAACLVFNSSMPRCNAESSCCDKADNVIIIARWQCNIQTMTITILYTWLCTCLSRRTHTFMYVWTHDQFCLLQNTNKLVCPVERNFESNANFQWLHYFCEWVLLVII